MKLPILKVRKILYAICFDRLLAKSRDGLYLIDSIGQDWPLSLTVLGGQVHAKRY